MKKRILAMLLTICMVMAMLPMAVLAADNSGLQALIDGTAEGGTITLSQDYTLTDAITISKKITINGDGHSITAPSGTNAIDVTADNVTLTGLTINASGSGYGVNVTGNGLKVQNSNINAVTRGINFYPTTSNGATLTVTGTTIKNTAVSNYDTTANYSGDNRGIATGNVIGGEVTISDSSILGFKYSINAVVTTSSSAFLALRDGNGTQFNITGTTIKGWTALNIWSANTNFTFTDCTLAGISTLSGSSNAYSTIQANDGIYGGNENKSSTVKFVGGTITAAKLGEAAQTVLNVDYELQTKYIFEQSYNALTEEYEPVVVRYYGSENTADSHIHYVLMWNFSAPTTDDESETYYSEMVSGDEDNVYLIGGTVDEYTEATSAAYGLRRVDVESGRASNAEGGAN
jgi:hypothetical protein